MSVDSEIFARLTAHAGLSALIGARVYADVMPPSPTYPLCVFAFVDEVPYINPDWTIYGRDARYQVSCYGLTRASALAVGEQAKDALHSFTSATIKRARYESMTLVVEPDSGPLGAKLYHVPVDFIVTYL